MLRSLVHSSLLSSSLLLSACAAEEGADVQAPFEPAAQYEGIQIDESATEQLGDDPVAPYEGAQNKAVTSSITQLFLVASNSSTVACPSGMTKIAKDLNASSGGAFIYLCYSTDPTHSNGYITKVSFGTSATSAVPGYPTTSTGQIMWPVRGRSFGYTRSRELVNDLNDGAGGDYIVMFAAYGGDSASAMKAVDILVSDTSSPTVPVGWVRDSTDLNKNAGGKYVYFIYKI